jgi:hypothetical protein
MVHEETAKLVAYVALRRKLQVETSEQGLKAITAAHLKSLKIDFADFDNIK